MKSPGIFVLTKREQRAAIVIAVALVALAMARHYREEKHIVPATSTSAEPSVTPPLAEEDSTDSDD